MVQFRLASDGKRGKKAGWEVSSSNLVPVFPRHDWVYSTEVRKIFGDPQPGDVISLKDFKDRPLGSAIYNPASQIVARRFSRRKQQLDLEFFERRLARAQAHREAIGVVKETFPSTA